MLRQSNQRTNPGENRPFRFCSDAILQGGSEVVHVQTQ